METLTIEFEDNKIRKLLHNLEELKLIKVRHSKELKGLSAKPVKNMDRKELGNLLASVNLKKSYQGMNGRAALEKLRNDKNGQ